MKFILDTEDWVKRLLKTWKGDEITIVSPFITKPALDLASEALSKTGGKMVFITNLDSFSIALGSLDAYALAGLLSKHPSSVSILNVLNLHAKVILTSKKALVGSANFTRGGLRTNVALGVETSSNSDLKKLRDTIYSWSKRCLTAKELIRVADDAETRFGFVKEGLRELELPAFPSENETYYDVVCDLLNVLTKGPKSRDQLTKSCRSEKKQKEKEKTAPIRRASFLINLGLVEKRDGNVYGTVVGDLVRKKRGNIELHKLIEERFPVYAAINRFTRDNAQELKVDNLKEHIPASHAEIETCTRWAVALDAFTVVSGGKKHIRSFKYNPSPGEIQRTKIPPAKNRGTSKPPSVRRKSGCSKIAQKREENL